MSILEKNYRVIVRVYPSRASYGSSIMSILDKNYRVPVRVDCITERRLPITFKFCTRHGNLHDVPCAEFQHDLSSAKRVIDGRDMTGLWVRVHWGMYNTPNALLSAYYLRWVIGN